MKTILEYLSIEKHTIYIYFEYYQQIRCRPAVRISGFHPGDPGSIPGNGIIFAFLKMVKFVNLKYYLFNLKSRISNVIFKKSHIFIFLKFFILSDYKQNLEFVCLLKS